MDWNTNTLRRLDKANLVELNRDLNFEFDGVSLTLTTSHGRPRATPAARGYTTEK